MGDVKREPVGRRTDRDVEDTDSDNVEDVADAVDDAMRDNPFVEKVTKYGWMAKGVVYVVMGLAALQIAGLNPLAERGDQSQASPEGAIGSIAEATYGRVMLAVLAVGLILYSCWRALSVAMIRGKELSDWADRIGYSFSALFYVVLAWSAAKAAISGAQPKDSNSVERFSRMALESDIGRVLLGVAGVVTMAVGAFFIVHKGIQRSFTKHLHGAETNPADDEPLDAALVIAGIAGWIGRGVVTILVGFFVTRAAVRFDPEDARGFDRSLRMVAGTSTGTILVVACAIGLVLYGVFCFASHSYRSLESS